MDLSFLRASASILSTVSLREEGVDLSLIPSAVIISVTCLPPRGGSGFKHVMREPLPEVGQCLPPRGGSGFKLRKRPFVIHSLCLPPRGGSGFKLRCDMGSESEHVSLREEGVDLSCNTRDGAYP